MNYLKRIDKVFNKGIQYYLDPKELKENKDASIFFRKEKFNSDLNFGSRKIVNQFENLKISLSTMSALSDVKLDRQIELYTIKDNCCFQIKMYEITLNGILIEPNLNRIKINMIYEKNR